MTSDQERALKIACAIEAGLSVVTPSLRHAIAAEILRAEARGMRSVYQEDVYEDDPLRLEREAAELEQAK